MKLLVTGSPGVGKTSVSQELGKALNCRVLNEKEFALEQGLGEWDIEENELIVDLKKLETGLKKLLSKEKNIIIEGHLLCEIRLPVDYAVLIRLDPELLQERISRRNYDAEKIEDNVFCEGIDYCKKHLGRRYSEKKIVEVQSGKTIKETSEHILEKISKGENGK